MKAKTMTLKLTDDQLDRLRQIAHDAGFVMKRGPMVGGGSVQQLIAAVADGDYNIAVWPANGQKP